MINTRETINNIKKDKKLRNQIYIITLIMVIIILLISINDSNDNTVFVRDKNDYVIKIIRNSVQNHENYNFDLKIIRGKDIEERTVDIRMQSAKDDKKSLKQAEEENRAVAIEAEISNIITEIELSGKKNIHLPNELSDGSRLIWSLNKEDNNSFFYIFVMYIALILLVINSSIRQDDKHAINTRDSILRGLPRFTNQLLLMLNAGVILSDAFDYICISYQSFENYNKDIFQHELVHLRETNKEHRVSTAMLINGYACKRNVKELMRISTILLENEKRGSNVIENLDRESKYLWDNRKIIARERGKMIDTRMSYPMGLLLIMLIIITMAPALMNL